MTLPHYPMDHAHKTGSDSHYLQTVSIFVASASSFAFQPRFWRDVPRPKARDPLGREEEKVVNRGPEASKNQSCEDALRCSAQDNCFPAGPTLVASFASDGAKPWPNFERSFAGGRGATRKIRSLDGQIRTTDRKSSRGSPVGENRDYDPNCSVN